MQVYSANINSKPLIVRVRLPWRTDSIKTALNLVGFPHTAEQVGSSVTAGHCFAPLPLKALLPCF
jgi:hypothetical protein